MMRVAAILLGLVASQAAAAETPRLLLAGRFDNELQVFFEAEQEAEAPSRARQHWSLRPADDGRLLLSRSPDAETGAEPAFALRFDADMMHVARVDGMAVDCMVRWTRTEDGHAGEPQGKACAPLFPGRLRVTAEGLEIGRQDGLKPDQLRRVRPFSCWVAVLRGARHGDPGVGAKDSDWFFTRNIWLHDQGGVATVRTDETPKRELRLRLRRVAWPSGPNRPSLTLYVLEPGNERAVSYAWAEFDAGRLGINLRWMQASCTHAPERLWP